MIELLVLRHAKSDWDAHYSGDHERPLSKRGRRAARAMGRLLAQPRIAPDLAVASTAVRARTTASLVLEEIGRAGLAAPALRLDESLYGAGTDEWLEAAGNALADSGRAEGRILVASHEPTCSSVVQALTGARVRFPTGAVAWIVVPRLGARGTLNAFLLPRLLETDGPGRS